LSFVPADAAGSKGKPVFALSLAAILVGQYVLVMKPFNAGRIAVSTSVTKENNSASLLAIQKPTTCMGPLAAKVSQTPLR
jgi:hypothetical protein